MLPSTCPDALATQSCASRAHWGSSQWAGGTLSSPGLEMGVLPVHSGEPDNQMQIQKKKKSRVEKYWLKFFKLCVDNTKHTFGPELPLETILQQLL